MFQMKQEARSQPSRTAPTGDVSPTEPWSVSRVRPDQLRQVWPWLQPQIWRGLERGAGDTLTEGMLYNGVMTGHLDLWAIHRGNEILAGIFLRIDERAKGKALVVLDVVAGSGHDFASYTGDILTRLREYGDMIGAYTIESYSRLGAARILSRFGCKPKAMIMELRDGRRQS